MSHMIQLKALCSLILGCSINSVFLQKKNHHFLSYQCFFQHHFSLVISSDLVLLVRSAEIRAQISVMELLSFVSLHERCSNFFKELLPWNRIILRSAWFIIIAILPPSFSRKPLIPWPLRLRNQKGGLVREYELRLQVFLCSEKLQA